MLSSAKPLGGMSSSVGNSTWLYRENKLEQKFKTGVRICCGMLPFEHYNHHHLIKAAVITRKTPLRRSLLIVSE